MSAVHKKIEIVGTSPESVETAIRNAVERAAASVQHLEWFEVDEIRGRIDGDAVDEFQVTLKVGFRIHED